MPELKFEEVSADHPSWGHKQNTTRAEVGAGWIYRFEDKPNGEVTYLFVPFEEKRE